MSQFECRMYENKFPEVDDVVMVSVRQIEEMGAYVQLLEYNNIEGMILLSELSRRRIRSVPKLIKVGRNEVATVLRVDREKGYIDLSKRRVAPEDIVKCEDRFNKSKAVHSIMRHVAEKLSTKLELLYTSIGWPLYSKFGHAYEAFKLAITEGGKVFEGLDVADNIINELVINIRRRLTPQPVKIRSDIEITCFSYEGIDAIRIALKAGEQFSSDIVPLRIKLVAPPLYVIVTQSLDKQLAIETMDKAIQKIEETIKEYTGELVIKMKPRAITDTDEKELAALMEKAERENAEISGDEEEDGDEANEEQSDEDDEEEEEGNDLTQAA